MARSNTVTQLSLDRFAEIIGVHPLHFNQVTVEWLADTHTCESPLIQYSWQDADRVGREEIALAIKAAEDMIFQWTHFNVKPLWVEDVIDYTRPWAPDLFRGANADLRGLQQVLKASNKYIQYGGVRVKTFLGTPIIVYTDVDSDGYSETATVTQATVVTDPEQLSVYYPTQAGDDAFEIIPTKVAIAGGVATITMRRERLVNLSEMESLSVRGVDGLDDSKFLTTVDVYAVENYPGQQVEFQWDNFESVCGCGLPTCSICTFTTQTGCMTIRNGAQGLVTATPALWNLNTEAYESSAFNVGRAPDKARLWYRAGLKYGNSFNKITPEFERAITLLAIAQLDRPLCSCGGLSAYIDHWQEDLTEPPSDGRSRSPMVTEYIYHNPFGTLRGAIEAWKIVSKYAGDVVYA